VGQHYCLTVDTSLNSTLALVISPCACTPLLCCSIDTSHYSMTTRFVSLSCIQVWTVQIQILSDVRSNTCDSPTSHSNMKRYPILGARPLECDRSISIVAQGSCLSDRIVTTFFGAYGAYIEIACYGSTLSVSIRTTSKNEPVRFA
jgi:hypothetical protein